MLQPFYICRVKYWTFTRIYRKIAGFLEYSFSYINILSVKFLTFEKVIYRYYSHFYGVGH